MIEHIEGNPILRYMCTNWASSVLITECRTDLMKLEMDRFDSVIILSDESFEGISTTTTPNSNPKVITGH